MKGMKKNLLKAMLFLVIQGEAALSMEFQKGREGEHSVKRETRIPVGVVENAVHYVTLQKGDSLDKLPAKISQEREKLGLSAQIPLDQQKDFFQTFAWKTAKSVGSIEAPMPGIVREIHVHKGQQVKKGDTLCMIESMKMECLIASPVSGVIEHILFKVEEAFNTGTTLISLLPSTPEWENIPQGKILEDMDVLSRFFPWASLPQPSPPSKEDIPQEQVLEDMELLSPFFPGVPPTPPSPSGFPSSPQDFHRKALSAPPEKAFSHGSMLQQAASPSPALVEEKTNQPKPSLKGSATPSLFPKPPTALEKQKRFLFTKPVLAKVPVFLRQTFGEEFKERLGISLSMWLKCAAELALLGQCIFILQTRQPRFRLFPLAKIRFLPLGEWKGKIFLFPQLLWPRPAYAFAASHYRFNSPTP